MKFYLAVAAVTLVGISVASAQQLSLSQKLQVRSDCGQDFQRLCPGMRPGPELSSCIGQQKDQLSAACSATLAKIKEQRQH